MRREFLRHCAYHNSCRNLELHINICAMTLFFKFPIPERIKAWHVILLLLGPEYHEQEVNIAAIRTDLSRVALFNRTL
jgi:hypothetical protein